MKRLFAIVTSLLLLWLPFAPAMATASPASTCLKSVTTPCASCPVCDCGMPCCVNKSHSLPQPAPVIPGQTTAGQNQLSLIAWTLVILTLPENPAVQPSVSYASPSLATHVPLYERHCTLLI